MAITRALRSPLAVTSTVWKALFLREALTRLTHERYSWFWLLVEPLSHVVLLMWVFGSGLRQRVIAGADAGIFIMLGILGFFLVRNIINNSVDVVASNDALYSYRQVKPVDTVLVRAVVEGLLTCILFLVMFAGAGMLGHPVFPADPLGALQALGALWLAGLGLGLVFSVLSNLVPEIGRTVRLLMTPLYFFSGAMIPSVILPPAILDLLLFNPIVHGIELLRVAFTPSYRVPPGVELSYLVEFAVMMIFLGLALHIRYRSALVDK